MSVSNVLLAITMILIAFNLFGWIGVASWLVGIFALATGIAMLLEGFGVYNTPYNHVR